MNGTAWRWARVRIGGTVVTAALAAAACGGDAGGAPGDGWTARTDTLGDTVVVRTERGSVWGEGVRLEEELRIGALEGADEYTFGEITAIAVAGDGTIYVLDRQAFAVRAYDAGGRHLRSFGRRGGGPGEFEQPEAMALLPDGRVAVRDPRNTRINFFSPDGESAGSLPIPGGFFTSEPLHTDRAGRLYTSIIIQQDEDGAFQTGLIALTPEGPTGDTIRLPDWGFEAPTLVASNVTPQGSARSMSNVPFAAQRAVTLDRDGRVVGGVSTRYAIERFGTDGTILRIERAAEPVPVGSGERTYREFLATRNMRNTDPNWRWNGPPIPAVKAPFTGVRVDEENRIWVQVAVPGEVIPEEERPDPRPGIEPGPTPWRTPIVYDVFEGDGRFLGRVATPPRFTWHTSRGDHVWGVVRDEYDVAYVARLRLVRQG
jgi:hypothetical protein